MTYSLHTAALPGFIDILTAIKGWLDKALLYGAHDEPLKQQFEDKVVPQTQRVREAFPGLRTLLFVKTPCVMYNHPSGPQVKLFTSSCVSSRPNPVNTTRHASGLSSPSASLK